jgi:hypothetical protein
MKFMSPADLQSAKVKIVLSRWILAALDRSHKGGLLKPFPQFPCCQRAVKTSQSRANENQPL